MLFAYDDVVKIRRGEEAADHCGPQIVQSSLHVCTSQQKYSVLLTMSGPLVWILKAKPKT